jgi:hypothetical protein
MSENNLRSRTETLSEKSTWSNRPQSEPISKRPKRPKFPPDADMERWLNDNAPLTFQQLADIRYCLYHRCGRADFAVSNKCSDDQFTLSGRHSKLRIISNRARHYLLWKLRLLGREVGWIGALPRSKRPREQK